MYEEGIIHDIVWDDVSKRGYHLELHCISSSVNKSEDGKNEDSLKNTRLWLTKDHLNRILSLLAPAVAKRYLDLINVACSSNNTKTGSAPRIELVEDEIVRVAYIFKQDTWALNKMKICNLISGATSNHLDESFSPDEDNNPQHEKLKIFSEKIVASAAINKSTATSSERSETSKHLRRSLTVNLDSQENLVSDQKIIDYFAIAK